MNVVAVLEQLTNIRVVGMCRVQAIKTIHLNSNKENS